MTRSHFLMVISTVSLTNLVTHQNIYSSLAFVFSILSFVVSEILVPSKEIVKKAELEEFRKSIELAHSGNAKEIQEIKRVVGELGNQVKVITSKVTGLRMEIGFKD